MMADANTSVQMRGAAGPDRVVPGEFLLLFKRQWKWAVATFVIVTLISIGSLSLVKSRWEAQATVRVGQVYDALSGQVRPIEPLQDVLERMREKSFSDDDSRNTARFEAIPPTGLIRITARASTAEEAARAVTARVDQLTSAHEELARAARSEVELLAEEYASGLTGLREMQSNLQKALSSAARANSPGADDGQSALATILSAMDRNGREMRELERQRFLLIRRSAYQSVPTKMIGRVSSAEVVAASRRLVVLFGIVMGLVAGSMVAVLRDHILRMRSQRLSA